MKRHILTLWTILLTITAFCQETKLVTIKFTGSKQISERYYVLKSDGKTKHGEYISYFQVTDEEYKEVKKGILSDKLIIKEEGYYKFGKKDGLWKGHRAPQKSSNGSVRQSSYGGTITEGNYKDDKKIGVWLTAKKDGITERFDYDNNKKLQPLIHLNTKYPRSAVEMEIEGIVTVTFKTNKDCSCSEIVVTKSLTDDCDMAAIEGVKKMCELLKKHRVEDCEEKTDTTDISFKLR